MVGRVETCARCGADLGVGRFCLNCGHQVGTPVPPHQQLLPWDEPVEGAAPSGSAPALRWIPWVGAAAVLLVVLGALAWSLRDDPDDSPDGSGGRSSEGSTQDGSDGDGRAGTPRARPRNVADTARITVPATAPATNDLDGQRVGYEAGNMVDGAPDTAWRMAGDGSGAAITLEFAQDVEVVRVGLLNGYAKQVAGVDWYPHNRRVLGATWTFDGDTSVDQTFTEDARVQRTKVPPVTTRRVTLTLTRVSPPGPGDLGRDYTALSEVVVMARPTG